MTSLVAAVHPWWPHLFGWPRFFDPVSWTWLSVKGYAFTSSGEQITILVALMMFYKHHQCSAPWCLRRGRHPTADGMHKLCRRHHPDVPDRPLTLAEIHERHHHAVRNPRRPVA